MNDDEEVVSNGARRTLVNLKRDVEIVQNTVEEAMHQLVRRIDACIAATGERRRLRPPFRGLPPVPEAEIAEKSRPSVLDDFDEVEVDIVTGYDDAGSKSSL